MRKGRENRDCSLEKRRLNGHLIKIYKYLKEGCKEDRDKTLLVVPSARTKGHKLEHRRFHQSIRKHFCSVWVMEQRNRLPRKVVESTPWRCAKTVSTWSWTTCSAWPCLSSGWTRCTQSSLPSQPFCDSLTDYRNLLASRLNSHFIGRNRP